MTIKTESRLTAARLMSAVAATTISLACGTNYIFSAWAPQFADRMRLSSTEINIIGTMGNLGMYAFGIPIGLLVDSKGSRPGVLLGGILLGAGYYPLKRAYDSGAGSVGVPLLCIFSFFTGAGSCSAFSAAIKTSALNYPDHRGTATAFPLAAFGLSAFVFSSISNFAFPDDTSKFLTMLSVGTFVLVMVPFLFLRVIPHSSSYSALPVHEPRDRSPSEEVHRTISKESRHRRVSDEIGAPPNTIPGSEDSEDDVKNSSRVNEAPEAPKVDTDETSSLLSKSSSGPGDVPFQDNNKPSNEAHGSPHLDVRGWALLPRTEFWLLLSMMGVLTGIGLMTINNIGNDAKALWRHYDDSAKPEFIQQRQLMHVSLLSFCSFSGRLLSGVGSDLLVKKLNMSRFWCLVISSLIFCGAQVCALRIENPNFLGFVSGLTGLAYGFLFGVYPSLVAHTFGVHGLSQNWGIMTLAPVVSGNIFNPIYGAVYDHHSTILPGGERECTEGLQCYRTAYLVTFFAGVGGLFLSLWSIWHEHKIHESRHHDKRRAHEREA